MRLAPVVRTGEWLRAPLKLDLCAMTCKCLMKQKYLAEKMEENGPS
jgi:hypothetical protein